MVMTPHRTLPHFGRVCMKRTTNPGHPKGKQAGILKARYACYSSDEDESHQSFQINPTQEKSDIMVTIQGTPVKVYIDSGTTVNTINYATYEAISAGKTDSAIWHKMQLHAQYSVNLHEICTTKGSWKDLQFEGIISGPPPIQDLIYHPCNFWNLLSLYFLDQLHI